MTARFAIVFLLACAPDLGQAQDTTRAGAVVKDLPLTAAQRQSYAGSYTVNAPWGLVSVRVFEERGVLKLSASDHPDEARRLLYQGDNVFVGENAPGFVFTFVMEGGRATGFKQHREDGTIVGVRSQ